MQDAAKMGAAAGAYKQRQGRRQDAAAQKLICYCLQPGLWLLHGSQCVSWWTINNPAIFEIMILDNDADGMKTLSGSEVEH
jgi:hypothetical protein